MKFGHFDDTSREYVIETPSTPLPWINYLGNDGFYSLISNTCGGFAFYRDAKLRRLTRFRYNNVPADFGGRVYYIKNGDVIWNPGFMPTQTKTERYICRHGLGYSIFESEQNGLSSELTCFVPLHDTCEINRLIIRNTGKQKKEFQLYSAVEWCLWNAVDDAANFQRNYNIGEVEIAGSAIYHITEYRERRDHYAFYSVNCPVDGFDTDRDSFLGRFRSWALPETVEQGISRNSVASGWAPIASHRIDVTLAPGEERCFVFLLGYIENPEQKYESEGVINKIKAEKMIAKYETPVQVQRALEELAGYWDELLERFHVESGDEKLDRMMNVWNQYQCMVTFNMSRSASYFESGTGRGMGFRDSCQDILGFVHLVPERARERILDIAAIQFEDGSTYHQYQPLSKRGNADIGNGFNDDPLWLVICTAAYIRETGDLSILEEPVALNNAPGSEVPLMEHLRRSIGYTIQHKGPHGLPLIGRADWNDCLNLNCFSDIPGESFQTCSNFDSGTAESIFIAGLFVYAATEYAKLCRLYSCEDEAGRVENESAAISAAAVRYGWDGEWFLRAYDALGNKVGANICTEGKIFIEPQGFCTMAGIGESEGLGARALTSVEKYLVNDYGVELLYPCYTRYYKELGEISSYPPGYKENGSVFCHNNPWISLAYARLHNREKAYETYMRNCPANIESVSEIHRTEPYVYSQTIAGRSAKNYGEAKNSWLTGTAAWSFVAASQGILGIQPHYDGLEINPCLPTKIGQCVVQRRFRGTQYLITIVNHGGNNVRITVDGEPVEGCLVRHEPGRQCREVSVVLE